MDIMTRVYIIITTCNVSSWYFRY